MAAMEVLPIEVRRLPMAEVEAAAVEAHGLWMAALGHPAAPLDGSDAFLRRLCLGHVCHALVTYERPLAATLAKVGGPAARCRLLQRILGAVATAYPTLATACTGGQS
jgi:hypothetical protein